MTKTMAEVLAGHQLKLGVRDMLLHCVCGWNGSYYPEATGEFLKHQTAALTGAGFGPVALPTMSDCWNDQCPCGHTWAEHNFEIGCIAGWEYDDADSVIASKDGCYCQLAHNEKSA